jgi:hypothetical protein
MKIILGSLMGIVLLCAVMAPLAFAQTREENSLWEAIKDSKDAEDYKAYLDKYPDGVYAPLARRRAAEFEPRAEKPAEKAAASTPARPQIVSKPVQETPIPKAPISVTMTECEGGGPCGTWAFAGSEGNGQWPSGETASLSVRHFDAGSVVIRRADSSGPSAGLTAVYNGTRRGDRIAGKFIATLPGRKDSVSGDWQATIEKTSLSLPMLMHVCIQCEGGAGATLVWDNGHYKNAGALPGESENFTVESFTRESVVLHRTDFGLHQGEATLTGRISAQGDSIVGGMQHWAGNSKNDHEFQAAWGDAIGSVPGSKGADPAVTARAAGCYAWFSAMICQ